MSRKTTLERFEAKFEPCPVTGCWLWNACNNTKGYGFFRHVGKNLYAHRFAYELYIGPVPDGMHVLHTCDAPWCVNPDHLFLGTRSDNMQDMIRKGRDNRAYGERNPTTTLTTKQVLGVYYRAHAGERYQDIAVEYRITKSTVSNIKTGRTWKHLTRESL